MNKILVTTFLILGMCNTFCVGQDPPSISLQFLTFPKSAEPIELKMALSETESLDLSVPCNDLSQAYKVRRTETWVFGETLLDEDDKPQFRVYGKAPSLSAANQIILLIRKGDKLSDGLEVIPLAKDESELGGGKFLFVNAAKINLAGEVGAKKFIIQPGKHHILQPNPSEDGTNFHAKFYYQQDDKVEQFFSSTWPYNKQARSIVFFYHDAVTKQLCMHTIQDF